MNKSSLSIYKLMVMIVLTFFISGCAATNKVSQQETQVSKNKQTQSTPKVAKYKTEEKDLKIVIGSIPDAEFGSLEVQMLDIRYALYRVTDKPIYDLPFYAMKDPKSDGYIGVIVGSTGKALFLVSPKALNETERKKLEKSIKAINGTAKTFNNNLQFAGKNYDPFEVLKLIEK